ncbi:hypothetical protein ABH37_18840 [Mycobacterium haemophilum]|uniref:Uncharacterized protein n=1 Tax=Mycobacterium haemophilum TaxID=29311 RepID=A0A0I9TXM0_9MYCO|nr:hypothetical protein ABH39_18510 [Mycobacterium haemophilum]KLO34504.1 hypothetical protein ABH38_18545 [Mycobacterium haemophilum]KLO37898.1 hypothetical protein ABH37_18840 [Mycobacterium haemophilum]KLO46243.1 hypothetical protein ABH36_18250 [Mycobacterium haemophilum]
MTIDAGLPVIVGVSDVTTAKTIRRAKHAQQASADAVTMLPVSYSVAAGCASATGATCCWLEG